MRIVDRVAVAAARPSEADPPAAAQASDYSPASMFRHLGRIIVGWLTVIIIVQVLVNSLASN